MTDRDFTIFAAEVEKVRAVWKKTKDTHGKALKARKVNFDQGLGPALDKWATANKGFEVIRTDLFARRGKLLDSEKAKINTKWNKTAEDLKKRTEAVIELTTSYLEKIEGMGGPAEKEVAYALNEIKKKATAHLSKAEQVRARMVKDLSKPG
jgi:hypothetical protein